MIKELENLELVNWSTETDTNGKPYMKTIVDLDDETRVVCYKPMYIKAKFFRAWFSMNNLKAEINNPYDCTGKWFSVGQYQNGLIIYDVQNLDI